MKPDNNDELERLAEIHSDFKEYVDIRHKQLKRFIIMWSLFLLVLTGFFFLEFLHKTNLTQNMINAFDIAKENRPKDGNMIPMPGCGNAPLLIPDGFPKEALPTPNTISASAEVIQNEKSDKNK